MADSIFKQHKLSLGIESGLELNDAQKRAFVANVKKISAQLQDSLDGAIREGISKDVIKDSMKDVVKQFNNEFKTLGIKTLDIDIDKIDIDDKPFKLIATQAAQNFTEAFKMSLNNSGIGDALSSEIIDSIDIVGGAVDKLFQRVEKRGKKSVAEIDSAIKKIKGNVNVKNADDETIRRKQLESEQKLAKRAEAVEKQLFGKVNVGKSSDKAIDNLKKTQESYLKAQNKGDWIKQYQDLLKFVQLYEGASKKFGEGFLAQAAELRDFYNALSSHKENATASLRDFVSLSRGQGTFDDSKGPWARESTLKEIKNVLEHKAGVKNTTSSAEGGSSDINSELLKLTETQLSQTVQSRMEAEERAKKAAEAIALVQEKMQKQGFAVYRGITEEDAMEARDEAKETYNAEYWAKDMATALSYALSSDDGFQTQLLKSVVNPKKPLILDAENHEYDDIRDMTALINTLEQLGMDIRSLLGNGPMTSDEIQGVINNFAASKGFDAVITNNVKDANVDGSPITTTVAILDDSILSAIQAFDVVEGVLKSTATKIAEWYHAPDQSNAAKIGEVDEALEGELDRLRQEQAAAQKDIDKYAKQEEKQQKEIDTLKKKLPAQSNEGTEDKALTPSEGGDQGGIASSLDSESIQVLANAIKEVLTSQVGAADTNQDQPAKETTLSKIHELLTSRLGTSSGKAPTGSAGESEGSTSKIAIDEGTLETVLNRITYDVKIAHDDADKTSNKIAIDESALESTLNRVFSNILSPKDDGKKPEGKKEPWALESTLNTTIKGILDQIQINTARMGQVPQTPANDSDNTLSQISKNVSEINSKVVKGSKATTKDTVKATKTSQGRDAQILTERIATQKLALEKFKTELETRGRMTDDVAKKMRGLAISLGMVKDSKGLTRWSEKFKQQKFDVGITDIASKESIAEQNANIKEWISLSKQLGELDAKINSGLFDDTVIAQAKQEREFVLRKIDEVMTLIKNPDDGFMGAGEANFAGRNDTINAQKSKKIGQLISQYEKLGQLQARAETSGAFVDREKYQQLSREVQSETEILHLHEEQNAELLKALQSRQENAYISEKDIEYAKEQKRLFTEYISIIKQIGKLDGVIGSDTADTISKQNAQIEKDALMRLVDDIRPRLDLTREDLISACSVSMAGEEASSIAQRQKAFTELAKQHKELGKLQAQEARTQVAELQKKIDAQRTVLQLTQEEQDILTQITEDAKQDALNKQTDKNIKKQTTNAKKMAQREAMLGKAGNAIGRAENTWISAVGLEMDSKAIPGDFKAQVYDYRKQLEELRKTQEKVRNTAVPVTPEQKKAFEQQTAELVAQINNVNKLTDEIGGLVAEYQKLSGSNVDETNSRDTTLTAKSGLDEYRQTMKAYVQEITNGKGQIKSFNAETKTLTYTVKTGKNEFTEYTVAVRNLDHQMVSVQGTTKRTETFFEATARKIKELTSYFSGMAIFSRISQELRRGIQYVREIDDALVELRKVTDETDESYDKFLRTAAKTGSVIGATISEVTEATATFSKLGYDMEMATEMAESAIVYKNVGDNIASAEDAADSIISTLKGFRLESSETMRIVDRFNEVGKSIAHVI